MTHVIKQKSKTTTIKSWVILNNVKIILESKILSKKYLQISPQREREKKNGDRIGEIFKVKNFRSKLYRSELLLTS